MVVFFSPLNDPLFLAREIQPIMSQLYVGQGTGLLCDHPQTDLL